MGDESFWEVEQYKRVVERVSNAPKLCDELVACVDERENLEKAYAKSLQSWAKKWEGQIASEKSMEFGTLKTGWGGLFTEAYGKAEAHLAIIRDLQSAVNSAVDKWKSENFHKSIIHFKETKLAEDGFEKAQKPWIKHKHKVDKYRKLYHSAAKTAHVLQKRATEAEGNNQCSAEECSKMAEKASKAAQEADVLRQKYEEYLRIITEYRPNYIRDMKEVFERWQEFEGLRIEFFKRTLLDYQRIVDVSNNAGISATSTALNSILNGIDSNEDLHSFSQLKGADMDYHWPEFEEWTPNTPDDLDVPPSQVTRQNSHSSQMSASPTTTRASPQARTLPPAAGTFDEDWGDSSVKVRALYDYVASDREEISFSEGDTITQLEGEDDQGWCRGTVNGRTGLYPASYVQAI
ncbi:hypothetical protein CAOG_00211 [Capsaspora owczarzaki ATCC 30864]|uniref:SH3 domain-containing protein n=1 Tax=Capsaspora owczarzaki (strain ATCC 30864) TaxID=595528 RepID=A0A0D2WI57_CAPO3|nr:hypothetical protein CAOG_00211 [Capsaspora owczarzaki ATCC 30864]KJE88573.1 hypothetical protein CAOG_000211 [Capsaspora owczarzaki ATCC 30864]|eukprot:XP_004365082.1 hypothetical protein CAOG_00211 [Capsaspora owczarzaki ATCC 30864]